MRNSHARAVDESTTQNKPPPGPRESRAALAEVRPLVERLEVRALLSAYAAATGAELVAAISATNASGGANTITLFPGKSFTLTVAADHTTTQGPNGLPIIAAGNDLTIVGNGDTISRNATDVTPFRLLDVAIGASLSLRDVTLKGGLAAGQGLECYGGAVFNWGTLRLRSVVVEGNEAFANPRASARGGGIYSGGVLTISGGSKIRNNRATGARGFIGRLFPGAPGAPAYGGGLYVGGGTATASRAAFTSNTAQGGDGAAQFTAHNGGDASGGGIYVGGGSVTLLYTDIRNNYATGGHGTGSGSDGRGRGGGLFINTPARAQLNVLTVAHMVGNTASTSDPNLFGTYFLFTPSTRLRL